jgi:gliding motility-associated-like protein
MDLHIFNRWGQTVFSTTDTNACWNGRDLSGKDLPAAVYFYVLTGTGRCNQKINRQGTITLIR